MKEIEITLKTKAFEGSGLPTDEKGDYGSIEFLLKYNLVSELKRVLDVLSDSIGERLEIEKFDVKIKRNESKIRK